MKESTLIEMNNKVSVLLASVTRLTQELDYLKDLAIGNMELTKQLPGYEEGLEKLKQSLKTKANEDEESRAHA